MHSLRLRLLPTLAALLFAASAAAQTSFDARGLADDAAAVIEREYFDPARALTDDPDMTQTLDDMVRAVF